MSNYPTLQQEFTAVIDNLKAREWIQGEEQRPDGAVCALTQEHIDKLMAPWVQVLGADWVDGVAK